MIHSAWGYKANSVRETPTTRGANDCPTPNKVGYDSRTSARRVARMLRRAGTTRRGCKQVAYLCACGFFHVGSQPHDATREQMGSGR